MSDPAPPAEGPGRGRTVPVVVAAVLVLALVALGGVLLLRGGQDEEQPTTRREPTPSVDQTPSASEKPEPEPEPETLPGRVTLRVLPPVSQQGDGPAAAADASPVVMAVAEPADEGAEVAVEQSGPSGWREVGRARQDAAGRAVLTELPAAPEGATYRGIVVDGEARSRPGPEALATGWRATFVDEFSGSALDPSRWSYRALGEYNPDGGRVCSVSDESAVSVGGGTVTLSVLADPDRADEECRAEGRSLDYYLNGHISTDNKFQFTHGIAAARARFQQPRGQHGAFWLQRSGVDPVPGRPDLSGAEIDVAEFFGEGFQDDGLYSFIYYENGEGEDEQVGGLQPSANQLLPDGDAWWRSYHVFSVEWTPEDYVFRVDGREFFRTTEGVSGVDQFLVLSLLSSDWELPRLDPATLPSRMDVDWVRVWQ